MQKRFQWLKVSRLYTVYCRPHGPLVIPFQCFVICIFTGLFHSGPLGQTARGVEGWTCTAGPPRSGVSTRHIYPPTVCMILYPCIVPLKSAQFPFLPHRGAMQSYSLRQVWPSIPNSVYSISQQFLFNFQVVDRITFLRSKIKVTASQVQVWKKPTVHNQISH